MRAKSLMHKAFFHGVIAATVDLHQEAELRPHHGRASDTARGQHEVDRVQVPRSVEDLHLAPERRISKTAKHLDGPGLLLVPKRMLDGELHELVNAQRSVIAVPARKRRETNREVPQDKTRRTGATSTPRTSIGSSQERVRSTEASALQVIGAHHNGGQS